MHELVDRVVGEVIGIGVTKHVDSHAQLSQVLRAVRGPREVTFETLYVATQAACRRPRRRNIDARAACISSDGGGELHRRPSHGAECFFVRDKWALCYYHDNHRGDGRTSIWCPSAPGVQDELLSTEPERFFKPPTSASGTFSAWLGVYLDTSGEFAVDWQEITAIIEDAYRTVAPKSLLVELDNKQPSSRRTRPRIRPTSYAFDAQLWRHQGEGSWHFVTLPLDQADEIDQLTSPARHGFGSVKVLATIGATTWHTSLFPDVKRGSFVLPIKKQVRMLERLEAGEQTNVVVEIVQA